MWNQRVASIVAILAVVESLNGVEAISAVAKPMLVAACMCAQISDAFIPAFCPSTSLQSPRPSDLPCERLSRPQRSSMRSSMGMTANGGPRDLQWDWSQMIIEHPSDADQPHAVENFVYYSLLEWTRHNPRSDMFYGSDGRPHINDIVEEDGRRSAYAAVLGACVRAVETSRDLEDSIRVDADGGSASVSFFTDLETRQRKSVGVVLKYPHVSRLQRVMRVHPVWVDSPRDLKTWKRVRWPVVHQIATMYFIWEMRYLSSSLGGAGDSTVQFQVDLGRNFGFDELGGPRFALNLMQSLIGRECVELRVMDMSGEDILRVAERAMYWPTVLHSVARRGEYKGFQSGIAPDAYFTLCSEHYDGFVYIKSTVSDQIGEWGYFKVAIADMWKYFDLVIVPKESLDYEIPQIADKRAPIDLGRRRATT